MVIDMDSTVKVPERQIHNSLQVRDYKRAKAQLKVRKKGPKNPREVITKY